uniref:Uncharacterized protein n=1 Tax=Anguilla anguilla TaxID=7936 RepID=A0A0E9RE63_ANGAN
MFWGINNEMDEQHQKFPQEPRVGCSSQPIISIASQLQVL